MPIVKAAQRGSYTRIENSLLEDERLSFEERGMLCYLLSKPANWKVRQSDLIGKGGWGRDKIKRMFAHLAELGYVTYIFPRGESGQICGQEAVIHESPRDGYTGCRSNPRLGETRDSVETVTRLTGMTVQPILGATGGRCTPLTSNDSFVVIKGDPPDQGRVEEPKGIYLVEVPHA